MPMARGSELWVHSWSSHSLGKGVSLSFSPRLAFLGVPVTMRLLGNSATRLVQASAIGRTGKNPSEGPL